MLNENISAISTPLTASGVAVIRISGDSPLLILEKMFTPQGKVKVKDFQPYRLYPGEFDGGSFKDYGLAVYFKAPNSYTGEEVVEIHCHGGVAIVKGLLQKTLELGARPATRGEFTKRAFLNGKLSLSSAEGLIDMINSESVGEIKAGYSLYKERLNAKTDAILEKLTSALAEIDADIDFPEEDLETLSREKIGELLTSAQEDIDGLLATYKIGQKLTSGVKVAICGKPNAGKSSVLNALMGYDKAIVSSIAGTTRDVVEGTCEINGLKFVFFDTAGIRETGDEIEGIGVERAKKTLNTSDLVLEIIDASEPNPDDTLTELIKDKPYLKIYNKSDLENAKNMGCDLLVSAKTGEGIEKLKRLVFDKALGAKIDLNGDFLTEERHFYALKKAGEKLSFAINIIKDNPLDMASIDIKEAWQALGEISGRSATEEVIDEIFRKFCVGK
ncbi:MAG: tRNA uridine-5-carboxymethylaminomethyl(34) synthesis GTPase MnmE [Clostridia bacterium]|nr:tRNA uridine-5-carboxymethylaminomethyl(34) synthesis GTPase MnmE [Clostridia bacterium]